MTGETCGWAISSIRAAVFEAHASRMPDKVDCFVVCRVLKFRSVHPGVPASWWVHPLQYGSAGSVALSTFLGNVSPQPLPEAALWACVEVTHYGNTIGRSLLRFGSPRDIKVVTLPPGEDPVETLFRLP